MSIQHHPDPSSLMAYAAGTLGEALSAVVAAHAERCPACRRETARLAALGGALLDGLGEPPAMTDSALAAVMARLDAPQTGAQTRAQTGAQTGPNTGTQAEAKPLPTLTVVERLLGGPLSQARWKRVAPGVKMIRLPVSAAASGELKLLHIGAGRAMPDHGHGGAEMTIVLEGAYADKFGRFGPGDVADLDADVDHEPTVEMGADCICLVASEHRARFKSGFMRMLQPWLRV